MSQSHILEAGLLMRRFRHSRSSEEVMLTLGLVTLKTFYVSKSLHETLTERNEMK